MLLQNLPIIIHIENRIHVIISNFIIKYIFINIDNPGSHGTKGTLKDSRLPETGCLEIIYNININKLPVTNNNILLNMESSEKSSSNLVKSCENANDIIPKKTFFEIYLIVKI